MLGALRLGLALAVLISHTRGYPFDDVPDLGIIAVVGFFFISGFLMPATFEANYRSASYKEQTIRYLKNRALRIYPMYWVVLAAAFALFPYLPDLRDQHDFTWQSMAKNVILLGLNQNAAWGTDALYIKPAWTLDIELQYYLLVPLIVWFMRRHRSATLLAMVIVSGAMLLLWPTGRPEIDRSLFPWTGFFTAGCLAYTYRSGLARVPRQAYVLLATLLLSGGIVTFTSTQTGSKTLLVLAIGVFATMQMVQTRPRPSRLDAFLGDLSYPLFISHSLVIQSGLPQFLESIFGTSIWGIALSNAIVSLPFAVALHLLVSPFVERIRSGIRTPRRATPSEPVQFGEPRKVSDGSGAVT